MKLICIPNNGEKPFSSEFVGYTENNCRVFRQDGEYIIFGGIVIEDTEQNWSIIEQIGNKGDKLFNFLREYTYCRYEINNSKKFISWAEIS